MDAFTVFLIAIIAVSSGFIGAIIQSLRSHRIAGITRPLADLRSAAVVAKQRNGGPVTYYMIGPQRLTKAEADADLERWRRAQISAASDPRTKPRDP